MKTCGLWSTTRTLVAAVIDNGILCPARSVAWSDDAVLDLLHLLGAEEAELVLPQSVADRDDLARRLRCIVPAVWCAPDELVDELRRCGLLQHRPARYSAAMLAWLPSSPLLRHHLALQTRETDSQLELCSRPATAPNADAFIPTPPQFAKDPELAIVAVVDTALHALVIAMLAAHPQIWDHERPYWLPPPPATLPRAERIVELAHRLLGEFPGYRTAVELANIPERPAHQETFQFSETSSAP